MEHSNKVIFLNEFNKCVGDAHVESATLESIADSHIDTLTAIRMGYFSHEDLVKISQEVARRLALMVATQPIQQAWQEIAEDFHSNGYWGFKTQAQKPKLEKKKNEVVGFLWTLFQAAVLMKLIVLYFAINAAELDSEWHYWGLGVALTISFGSLMFFAWRKSKTYVD